MKYLILVLSGLLLFSCKDKEEEILITQGFFSNNTSFVTQSYNWQQVPMADLPYYNKYMIDLKRYFYDKDSVVLLQRENAYYYHPVWVALVGYRMLNSFRISGDSSYLRLAKRNALKMVKLSKRYKGAMYFPYSFDVVLHNDDELKAPWYSGMAQGQLLSFFARIYELSGDIRFKGYADSTFKSFTNIQYNTDPWVTAVDSLGNFWIEEYPVKEPDLTLNGFIFAIFGLYDYHRLFPSDESKKILDAATYTIEKNVMRYRCENGISYYCIKHKVQAKDYHKVHIDVLNQLATLSAQSYFSQVATTFAGDYKITKNFDNQTIIGIDF